jgi:hypothetical protein
MFIKQLTHRYGDRAVIIEATDRRGPFFTEQVISMAQSHLASGDWGSSHERFFVLFPGASDVGQFSEAELRELLRRPESERRSKTELLSQGADALVDEVLETFEFGNLGPFARKHVPPRCRAIGITTMGQLARHVPQLNLFNIDAQLWVDVAVRHFHLALQSA